ncbi:MAG: aldehyde dehydrogenase (NADP(+)) [Candidatus Aminicenantes bacterium]|nr:aldehyde dehydrogenase (NADP(+)) [Candidatus Aminicenantes bacterium]
MKLTGEQIIGTEFSKQGKQTFNALNPDSGGELSPVFYEATAGEVDRAVQAAEKAFPIFRGKTPNERAGFLEKIGEEILALDNELIERCKAETALPEARLVGERGRTINQLNLFAAVVREGSWVGARIDTAVPERQPLPKPGIRQMRIPVGPVAVFGAGNFPLAFSVAGGDTASALAAGCPVVVKAHPAHPGASELVGRAIIKAAAASGMPDGVFSLVQGQAPAVGMALIEHPLLKAVGFTGSFKGGKAIFDAAVRRSEPIPVYAEMGSSNPVFILPGALEKRAEAIARGLAASVTLGVGQFCTNPGLVTAVKSAAFEKFVEKTGEHLSVLPPGTMTSCRVKDNFAAGIEALKETGTVEIFSAAEKGEGRCAVPAYLLRSEGRNLLKNSRLAEEVFGPSTLVVAAAGREELLEIAAGLEGHLTATIHGEEEELVEYRDLIALLERKVGRLIINGFPTGVEVCPAMFHGGPFPAATDSRSTSVGTAAIERFARPVCYQDFPQALLPDELKDGNPRGIFRLVNSTWTKDGVE